MRYSVPSRRLDAPEAGRGVESPPRPVPTVDGRDSCLGGRAPFLRHRERCSPAFATDAWRVSAIIGPPKVTQNPFHFCERLGVLPRKGSSHEFTFRVQEGGCFPLDSDDVIRSTEVENCRSAECCFPPPFQEEKEAPPAASWRS